MINQRLGQRLRHLTRPNLLGQSLRLDPKGTGLGTVEYELPLEHSLTHSGWVLVNVSLVPNGYDPTALPPLTFNIRTNQSEVPRESLLLLGQNQSYDFGGITKIYSDKDQRFTLEVLSSSHALKFSKISLQPISRLEAMGRLLFPRLRKMGLSLTQFPTFFGKLYRLLRASGFAGLKRRLRKELEVQHAPLEYHRWIQIYDTLSDEDRRLIRAQIAQFKYLPRISIVMPVYNVAEQWLRLAIESVQKQLYPHWELCIADDCSSKPHIAEVLKEFAQKDSRIKFVIREKNGHISAASNTALELATGEFVALLDHDDELPEHALYFIAQSLNRNPETDIFYSDEDKIDEFGRRYDPHFKSQWNPDLFHSYNLINHLAVYRTKLVKATQGFRIGYEGSQDYDLALRVLEQTTVDRIQHIPHILYHWRAIPGSAALSPKEKKYAIKAGIEALKSHFQRTGIKADVVEGVATHRKVIYPIPRPAPLVSLLIGTRDRVKLLKGAVEGFLERTDYPNLEIIIVDNQSEEPETREYFEELRREPRVRVLPYDAPFNFSAINNFAAKNAKGELIALINNDLLVLHKEWLTELVTHALRPDIGAVGAKLYYHNNTIQHAGVILGIGGINGSGGVAGHGHKYFPRDSYGYVAKAVVVQNLSAITGACMLLRRSVFEEVGGLDEKNLAVAFNDIDFCLRIREKGYRVVFTPFSEVYHLESASRGSDATPENQPRFRREVHYMRDRWGKILDNDPYYNPNLTFTHENYGLAFPPRVKKPWL
ncbi:glycosyltransferase family 2 protein [Bdellovibrionota bacterium FG-2]